MPYKSGILWLILGCIWCSSLPCAQAQVFIQSDGYPQSEFNFYTIGGTSLVGLASNGFVFDLWQQPSADAVEGMAACSDSLTVFRGRILFEGCHPSVPEPIDTGLTVYHQYIGNIPHQWRVNQPTYTGFRYRNFYEGIDLIAKIDRAGFKYEFAVSAGADPNQIRWRYAGFDATIATDGSIVLANPMRSMREKAPYAYLKDEANTEITSEYVEANGVFSFALANYDTSQALIIDPEVVFCTYGLDIGFACSAPAPNGKVVTGNASGGFDPNSELVGGGIYIAGAEVGNALVECFSPDGTALEWLAVLGGDGTSSIHDMDIATSGEIALLGSTRSTDFPTTPNAYDTTLDDFLDSPYYNPFVAVLSATGSELIGSTYADFDTINYYVTGGTVRYEYQPELTPIPTAETRMHIAIKGDKVYVGWVRIGDVALEETTIIGDESLPERNIFIAQLNITMTTLNWSCMITSPDGELGSSQDSFGDIEPLSNGNLAVCGWGRGALPLVSPALDESYAGEEESWIAVFDEETGEMLHATYFGGEGEEEAWVLYAMEDQFAVLGKTNNPENYGNANLAVGDESLWINVYSNDLSELVSHYRFGPESGIDETFPISLGTDPCGNLIFGLVKKDSYLIDPENSLSGWWISEDALQTEGLTYFGRINTALHTLEDATYFGGFRYYIFPLSKVNASGQVAHGSWVLAPPHLSAMNPTPGAFGTFIEDLEYGYFNHAVALIDMSSGQQGEITATPSYTVFGNCAPYEVELAQAGNVQEVVWQLEGDTLLIGAEGVVEFTEAGSYQIEVIVRDSSYCNVADSVQIELVLDNPASGFEGSWEVPEALPCVYPQELTLAFTGEGADSFLWEVNNQEAGTTDQLTLQLTSSGVYTISLWASDSLCEVDSVFTAEIEMFDLPEVSIEAHTYQATACDSVWFEGEAIGAHYDLLWWYDTVGDTASTPSFEQAYGLGSYTITLEAYSEHCEVTATDSYTVEGALVNAEDMHLELPNVISPQNDGQNDVFRFFPNQEDLQLIDSFELRIFNRWGTELYVTHNPYFRWDGTLEGEPLHEGVYTYILRYSLLCNPADFQSQSGSFQLLR